MNIAAKEELPNAQINPPSNDMKSNDNGADFPSSVYHPCSILQANPEIRHRKNFAIFACDSLKNGLKNLKGDDEAMKCWTHIVDRFEAEINLNQKKTDTNDDDSKENIALNVTFNWSDSDNEEAENMKSETFSGDFSKIDSKIVEFYDNKLGEMAMKFSSDFLYVVKRELVAINKVPITPVQSYKMLRSIPVLDEILLEKSGKVAKDVPDSGFSFNNWGLTQHANPAETRFLNDRADIIEFIREAREDHNPPKRVRVAAYAHSWSPMFVDDGDYLAKLFPDEYTDINPTEIPLIFNADFTEVTVKGHPLMFCRLDEKTMKVVVGAATPNIMYVRLIERRFIEEKYTFPSEFANVIQLHQSFVGTHGVSCHGSGITTTVITDYVTRLNIINWEGQEIIYNDEKTLKTMACHFGLLGIVTEMELQYSDTYYALYFPRFVKFEVFMPQTGPCPLLQEDVEKNYYNEYFWWPQSLKGRIYVNSFPITPDHTGAQLHPSPEEREFQVHMAMLIQFVDETVPRQTVDKRWVALLIAILAELTLDNFGKAIKTPSADGLHFRYGIQNYRVLDTEWVFPLPGITNADGKRVPDMTIARDLFWAARKVADAWAAEGKYPQLQPLEMRIIKSGSNIAMTWGKGSEFVCLIEILTSNGSVAVNDIWKIYCQNMVDAWVAVIEDKVENSLLLIKPHWGKEWQHLTVKGRNIYDHLRDAYKSDIEVFNAARIVADPKNMFINNSWAKILGIDQ